MVLFCGVAHSAQVTLSWNPVSGSTLAGYKLFYGTQSARYTGSVDAGKTTQYTIANLNADTTYYFAAKTYDANGNESVYSSEVSGKTARPNSPPQTPVLYLGSSTTPVATNYSCRAAAHDPDGDVVQYRFDWGDGTASAWGAATQSHRWAAAASYCIKGQARDPYNALSSWSGCYNVLVTDSQPPAGGGSDPGDPTPGDNTGGTRVGSYKFWIEAEDGDISTPMQIAGDDDASLGGYVWAPNGSGTYLDPDAAAGLSTYRIRIPVAGRYQIWARTLSSTYSTDSFFVSVNDGAYARWDTPVAGAWVWSRIPFGNSGDVLDLSQGVHTFTLLQREDGTKIDRILVCDDMDYVPQGKGETIDAATGIWLEAEDGTLGAPMQVMADANASGGRHIGVADRGRIHTTPDPAAGYAEYEFNVPQTGDYRIWGRVLAPSWSDDSFFVSVDGQPFIRWNPEVGSDWHWEMIRAGSQAEPLLIHLRAGRHTLTILCREDGTLLDKILITDDPAFTPAGKDAENGLPL